MLRIGDIVGLRVFREKKEKKGRKGEKAGKGEKRLAKVGKVHMAVFSPDGRTVVGFTVKRPDVAGMVARDDIFVARDGFATIERGLLLKEGEQYVDDGARERLGLDWDACLIWSGMDARTSSGRELGYVNDAIFDNRTGQVDKFCIGDGNVSQALVGSVEMPVSMLVGYSKGYMIVAPEVAHLSLSGGAAAAAGEGYARARVAGKQAAEKTGAAVSEAADKGSYALGRAIGKARRAIADATQDDEEDEPQLPEQPARDAAVSAPESAGSLRKGEDERAQEGPPKTYAPAKASADAAKKPAKPAAKKPAAKKPTAKKPAQKTQGDKVAHAVGKEMGRMGSMFGSFMDEYRKASK